LGSSTVHHVAMDFDDLDGIEGEEEEPAKVPRYEPFDYMPPIPRSFRLPSLEQVPDRIKPQLPEQPERKICIRGFVFYGAGDTWYNWAMEACKVPAWGEIAVHEWTFHGSRDEEDAFTTLDAVAKDAFRAIKPAMQQHAKGGRIENAPFIFIGHSIGCLVIVAVAKMVREEFGLEPAACVMFDRGPPHIPLHSEVGQKLRDEDPWEFMKRYNFMVYNTAKLTGGAKGDRQLQMWIDDVKIGSDTRPVGYHTFNCDLLILRGMKNFDMEKMKDSEVPEERMHFEMRDPLMGSPPGHAADVSYEQFEEWRQWTTGKCTIMDIDASHIQIKANTDALNALYGLMEEKKAPDPENPP